MCDASISLVLEEIDGETGSIAETIHFDATDIQNLPYSDDLFRGCDIYLEAREATELKRRFGLGDMGVRSRIRARVAADDTPYPVHTGRELLMMLQGKKPMAAFSALQIENLGSTVYFDQAFKKYIENGAIKFWKRTLISDKTDSDGNPLKVDYFLYAIPGEEWRAEAYFLLMKMMNEVGWCQNLERMEGLLLGYSPEESAIHIEKMYGKACK